MRTVLIAIALLLACSGSAMGEGLDLAFGAYGAMSSPFGEPIWMAGLLLLAGPSEGLQARLGVGLAWPAEGALLQLETLVLLNLRLGAWVYLGGGIGVSRLKAGTKVAFPLIAAAGLKTRKLPQTPWRFFVEGKLLFGLIRHAQLEMQWSAGVTVKF